MTRIVYTGTRAPKTPEPGVELHHLPMLESIPRRIASEVGDALRDASRKRFALFYSRNAAEHVCDVIPADAFDGCELWAVGARTAQTLADRLSREVHSPKVQTFAGLLAELEDVVAEDALVVSFELASSERDLALRATILNVPTYETVAYNYDDLDGLLRRIDPRWVLFASPRAYEAFRSNLHHRPVGDSYRVAAIGTTTRDAILDAGDRVDFVPDTPDLAATLRALAAS